DLVRNLPNMGTCRVCHTEGNPEMHWVKPAPAPGTDSSTDTSTNTSTDTSASTSTGTATNATTARKNSRSPNSVRKHRSRF
ncbi:MAG: hypothetical protein ACXVCI_03765, partial [Bdellovibrionota bacterium]